MPDVTMSDELLIALRDLGISPPPMRALERRCRAALQREIDREQRVGRRRRFPGHRRRLTVALSIVVVVGATGAGYAALSGTSELSAGIDCHAGATLNGGGTITQIDGRPATQVCAQLWAQGAVVDGVQVAPGPLLACVASTGSGAIHVFASSSADVCARLGLRDDPGAGADPTAQAYAKFENKLSLWLNATSCPTLSDLRNKVQAELASAGLTGWVITSHGSYDGQHPCASVALSSTARVVTIIPTGSGQ
jgi:hypothetical protein